MLRRCSRFAALLGLNLLFLPLALGTRLVALCGALCGARRLALRLAAATQLAWARSLLFVLGVELALEGTAPPGAFLVVANHLSYLDIPVLAALFPGRFVAKSEIAGWPVLGQMAATVGTIFVEQKRRSDVLRVEREMTRTLAAGVPVLLFPEGRSTRGLGVERLHSSLLECAVRARIPCLAVALGYETPDDPWAPASTVCWWGGMGFWRHAWGLTGLARIRARVAVAPELRLGTERKGLARTLQAELAARFTPVRQAPLAPDCPWPELFREEGEEAEPARGSRATLEDAR
jgi:1-acyl-sn-glycerol-3-phosphate acyltransferase